MELSSDIELANTRAKLSKLESLHQKKVAETAGDSEMRELATESLKRLINQLKEEIARYEAHQVAQQ